MFLSESTIKSHIGRIFEKFRCCDSAQVVIAAYESRLVHPGQDPRHDRGRIVYAGCWGASSTRWEYSSP